MRIMTMDLESCDVSGYIYDFAFDFDYRVSLSLCTICGVYIELDGCCKGEEVSRITTERCSDQRDTAT
jgi:hypothetical protein